MRRTILLYGVGLGVFAVALEWLQYRYVVRAYAPELLLLVLAVAFTALGLFAGRRLTARAAPAAFERNDRAIATLGVTDREFEVLGLLASGCANKEIARRLGVSPNTVKTHVSRLYEKLEVDSRTRAVQRARELALIP